MKNSIKKIIKHLSELEIKMTSEVDKRTEFLNHLHPSQVRSAKNLIHYLTLRNQDVHDLQNMLHIHGLSSLASAESHVKSQLQAIMSILGKEYKSEELDVCTYSYSTKLAKEKCKDLFGKNYEQKNPYIMVTFDTSFAGNYDQVEALLIKGMNIARINCAHDDELIWLAMLSNIKMACKNTGLSCKVYMDLSGPKIRTKIIKTNNKKGKAKIKEGETFWLAYEASKFKKNTIVISPDEPGILAMLQVGDRIYIDDGLIKGNLEIVNQDGALVRIKRISSGKKEIKSNKGINFPDSEINISSLTDYDKSCLSFVCAHADMVGFSFVSQAKDLAELQETIEMISPNHPHIIIKIETPAAVNNLPDLLLQGMKQKSFGVMIARGDLAVEIGFERMGEIQEEILWICEAAHVPVIWATQVLESLNKSGIATRSEITDAGHAALAECVMINKGKHTLKVIETYKDILLRIRSHQVKKRFLFRRLSIANRFLGNG